MVAIDRFTYDEYHYQLNNKQETTILNKMYNNIKDKQSHQQQNSESFQSLLQSQQQFQRKKRVTIELYAEISSSQSRKDREKIVYFDEQFQEVEQLIPNRYSTSSNPQNIEISINSPQQQYSKRYKKGKKIAKSHQKSPNVWKKLIQFQPKNQYDKNMFSNITKVIIKKIFDKNCQKWVKSYCILFNVNYCYLIQALRDLNLEKIRIGTSELKRILLNSNLDPLMKRIFSILMVDFLQNDFLNYVLQEGKMKEPEKYLRCASKMIYIPRLSRQDYEAMTLLRLGELQK